MGIFQYFGKKYILPGAVVVGLIGVVVVGVVVVVVPGLSMLYVDTKIPMGAEITTTVHTQNMIELF